MSQILQATQECNYQSRTPCVCALAVVGLSNLFLSEHLSPGIRAAEVGRGTPNGSQPWQEQRAQPYEYLAIQNVFQRYLKPNAP